MLFVEKLQDRNCKQYKFEDYKSGLTYFDINCFIWVIYFDVKIDWKY